MYVENEGTNCKYLVIYILRIDAIKLLKTGYLDCAYHIKKQKIT